MANERTTCLVLIETAEGAENADAVAATTGVDCLWFGHFDLSTSLGVAGQFDHPDYRAAHDRIVAAVKQHNKSLGRLIGTVDEGFGQNANGE